MLVSYIKIEIMAYVLTFVVMRICASESLAGFENVTFLMCVKINSNLKTQDANHNF